MNKAKKLSSFADQLIGAVLPKQVALLLFVFVSFVILIFLARNYQLDAFYENTAKQASSHFDQHIGVFTQQVINLANNDLVVNSLIDSNNRSEYLPLLFQSLRINTQDDFSLLVYDYKGEMIARKNLSKVDTNWFEETLKKEVLTKSKTLITLDKRGLLVATPILLSGLPEGAVVFFIEDISNLIPEFDTDLNVEIETGDHEQVINEDDDLSNFTIQRDFNFSNHQVLIEQNFTDAFKDVFWMCLFALVVSVLAVFGNYLVTKEAAKRSQQILEGFASKLKTLTGEQSKQNPTLIPMSQELEDIENTYQSVLRDLVSASDSSERLGLIFNGVMESIVLLTSEMKISVANDAFYNILEDSELQIESMPDLCRSLIDGAVTSELTLANTLEKKYTNQTSQKDLWVSWYASAIDQNEKIIGYVLVGQDITLRKIAEEELLIKNAAIDKANTSIIISEVHDSDQPIIYANQAYTDLTGFPREAVLGKNCNLLQGRKTESEQVDKIRQALINERPVEVTLTNYKASGEEFLNRLSLSPVKNADGEVKHYIGFQKDVTKEVQTEKLLIAAKHTAEESAQLKSDFLASMSHEIRTPINGISGTLQLLDKTTLDDNQKRYVSLASKSTENLLTIINDILDFSKIEAGKLKIEKTLLDIEQLIADSIGNFESVALQKGLLLTSITQFEKGSRINGDPVRIRQIVDNLVGNAIKFTEKGEVNVSARWHEPVEGASSISISVKDTGVGIAKNKLAHIFEHFAQEDNTTTRQYGGSGLGLAICKQLCDLMGGEIIVDSEKGKGSEFTVVLPAERAQLDHSTIDDDVSLNKDFNYQDCTVLLVEDNEINRVIATEQLSEFTLFSAKDGKEALKWLNHEKSNFDVVLMDCQMPVMDGYECTKAIRRGECLKRYQDIPIIALTANAMKGDKERCLEAGMDDYLSKPFNAEQLCQSVIKWFETRNH